MNRVEAPVTSEADDRNGLAALAKSGRLRAAINIGNAALAQRDGRSGALTGVSPAIARELSCRIGCELDLVIYPSAGTVSEAAERGEGEIAFLARDPGRADRLAFSIPYVAIEGTYIVRKDSGFRGAADIDRPGQRVCVTHNAAYDHILTRQLEHAEIVRAATPMDTLALFIQGGHNAAAGIRQPLENYAQSHPELKVLEDRFALIEQCIAVPKSDEGSIPALDMFLAETIKSGMVRRALDLSGQQQVAVATEASLGRTA
jgi:polar amino acid transport system substrate-binding protein